MRTHPLATGTATFLLMAISTGASTGASFLAAQTMSFSTCSAMMPWSVAAWFLPVLVWPGVLAWLLVRTARRLRSNGGAPGDLPAF